MFLASKLRLKRFYARINLDVIVVCDIIIHIVTKSTTSIIGDLGNQDFGQAL
ncbi:hypothetical protein RSAG8_00936, partial [Rhizoctonia solani AG-8 WAC10335]